MSESLAVQTCFDNILSPSPSCSVCKSTDGVIPLGDGFICSFHLADAVSIAANDVWPGDVTYNLNLERFLIWG